MLGIRSVARIKPKVPPGKDLAFLIMQIAGAWMGMTAAHESSTPETAEKKSNTIRSLETATAARL
jgi:hypothetical protein